MHWREVPGAIRERVVNYVSNYSNEEGKYMECKLLRECKLG